jgi:hypothetical protein
MMRLPLALLLCSAVHAANWYVSPIGSDVNPGTQALPLATFQKAHDLAAAGDTILGMDGTYLYSGSANTCCGFLVAVNKANLMFRAVNRRAAIIDVNLKLYSAFQCLSQCSGLTVQGFVIRNGAWSGVASNSGNGKNLTVRDNEIGPICTRVENSQTGCTGVFTDSAATGVIDGNYIHNIGRTNDVGNTFDHGVYTSGHVDITNNQINPWSGWAIQTAGGFNGNIAGDSFNGPVRFDNKPGQIMLWGANGAVNIASNNSTGSLSTFITQYAWTSTACSVYGNVSTVPLGTPPGCSTVAPTPPAQTVTVTVNGTKIPAVLPVSITIQ